MVRIPVYVSVAVSALLNLSFGQEECMSHPYGSSQRI